MDIGCQIVKFFDCLFLLRDLMLEIWDSTFEGKHEQHELDLPDVATIILKARILYYFGNKSLILSLIYKFKCFPDIFTY